MRMVGRERLMCREDGWQDGGEEEDMSRMVEGGQQGGTETLGREKVEETMTTNIMIHIIIAGSNFSLRFEPHA